MNTAALFVGSSAFALAAFIVLSAGMDRHREDFLAALPADLTHGINPARALTHTNAGHARMCGWLLLAASFAPCLWQWPAALAALVWLGLLSVAGVATGLMWTYAPQRAPHTVHAALAVGALAACVWAAMG